jgi:hypothetical protein
MELGTKFLIRRNDRTYEAKLVSMSPSKEYHCLEIDVYTFLPQSTQKTITVWEKTGYNVLEVIETPEPKKK